MATPGSTLQETRLALQQVAVHVLARRRHAVTKRFGLRPSPGGIATPAFGEDAEIVRTCGRVLVVERGATAAATEITTLAQVAELAGVDLADQGFSVGADTPALVDPEQPLTLDDEALDALADWYAFGSMVMDELVAQTPQAVASATSRQLWPEHFDLGCSVTVRHPAVETRANLGASPGDAYEALPYLYLGPWDDRRPGDAAYWNAPFGAVLRSGDITAGSPRERRGQALAFFRHGLGLLATD